MSQTYITQALRREVITRAESRCEYCKALMGMGTDLFAIEHIIPEKAGGLTILTNLALACSSCNTFKGSALTGKDPITEQIMVLFHPRQDGWPKHFLWSDDALRIIGITPTGRATVALLRMNQQSLINLRQLLRDAGLHPPATQ
ncbi:HNH endonuclease [Armatimonas sp.]|uniref:HNH endonuclease n=1 Tax=Armatimonas sp. TaxID=1872638 RepID=UPI003751E630